MESAVQPLPVSQSNHMVDNPHYGQQMQYQTNGYNQYYSHQPQIQLEEIPQQNIPGQPMSAQQMPPQQMPAENMPAQEMPIDMTASAVTAKPVNDPPAYSVCSIEEPETTETEKKTIETENEQNSESRPIELEVGSEPNVTVPVEDTSSETTMKANTNV